MKKVFGMLLIAGMSMSLTLGAPRAEAPQEKNIQQSYLWFNRKQ